jgi:hypothetical protein
VHTRGPITNLRAAVDDSALRLDELRRDDQGIEGEKKKRNDLDELGGTGWEGYVFFGASCLAERITSTVVHLRIFLDAVGYSCTIPVDCRWSLSVSVFM